MKTIIFLLIFATAATAQNITGGKLETSTITLPRTLSDGYYFSLDSVPGRCWGVPGLVTTLTTQDKKALRLHPSEKMKWYDFKTYRFKGQGKRAVWIGYAVGGILHGGREAYHAEPTVFEKRFGVGKTSWFGSEQWRRNYVDLDPTKKHKPNVLNTFRDYYHFSSTAHTTILVSGAVIIGTGKQPVKYKIADAIIALGLRSVFASLTYNALR